MNAAERKIISTPNAPKAIGPYAQAVQYGDLMFVSGMIPLDPETGELVTGTFEAEVVRVIENIKAIVEAGGMCLKNVLKSTVFLKDLAQFRNIQRDLSQIFWRHSSRPRDHTSSQAAAGCVNRDVGNLWKVKRQPLS